MKRDLDAEIATSEEASLFAGTDTDEGLLVEALYDERKT